MAVGLFQVYADNVVTHEPDEGDGKRSHTNRGKWYYAVSNDYRVDTYLLSDQVIALQKEEYYLEDECVVGCKIITTNRIFHTPDDIDDVKYELGVRGG
jgi:hypothetical protein